MKVYLKYQPTKRQFYCPTLKRYLGRKQLRELITERTITEIEYLGSEWERKAAINYLISNQQPTMHDVMKERK